MPIKPEHRAKYGRAWKRIRERILARAKHRCEQCHVPNDAVGYRDEDGAFVRLCFAWRRDIAANAERIEDAQADGYKVIRIVLTVAHLDHNPEHNDPANLRALCQRCHLAHDQSHHQQSAYMTRMAKRNNLELPL
ncbi:MAG: hypothetical protein HYU77_13745 [Betaproteobacteria bacterium]|nr:hypothetical protein [Betaproteobacteria bacterium]